MFSLVYGCSNWSRLQTNKQLFSSGKIVVHKKEKSKTANEKKQENSALRPLFVVRMIRVVSLCGLWGRGVYVTLAYI